MKFLAVSVLLLVDFGQANVLQPRNSCNADNCARAVTGTGAGVTPAFTSRKADCSSFLMATVTPSPTTVTVYTSTSPGPVKRSIDARDAPALAPRQMTVHPSSVPTYASACSGTSRYSSACSCFGVSGSTTTAPTPTVTVTASVPGCYNGGICGTYVQCSTPNADCFCGLDSSNNAICFQDESCDSSKTCVSNDDCVSRYGSGNACLVNSCCSFSICAITNVCVNPANKIKMMFLEKKDGGMQAYAVGPR